ncbi:hypothetical protein IQ229_01055 [Nostoc cf. edaphicum LEGE 07299]|uniref:Uncharacterized protein n=1 Tax=Nostoc cf. edaphicum LEGE 07299 TaxID=2777974 RepID=A0ABR9TT63_9NOSO|nr:hypothetical protein [Nostoc edaphicum]MBE9103583.1 hypothetical protein [Nostoc cf. edaphicum LEGE 07299]
MLETAQELLEYEAEEDEKITAKLMKNELTARVKRSKDKIALPLFPGDKYAVAAGTVEREREETLQELNDFLSKLNYI